jgi:hypothetical protein
MCCVRSPLVQFRFTKLREDAKLVYNDLRIAEPVLASSQSIACSTKWIAVNWGANSTMTRMLIMPTDHASFSLAAKIEDVPLINAHSDLLGDLAFNPFHPDVLVTGSKDATVKVHITYASSVSASNLLMYC